MPKREEIRKEKDRGDGGALTDGLLRLQDGAALLGIEITVGQATLLLQFMHKLLAANRRLNLTAVTEPDAALELHLLDSLTVLRVTSELQQDIKVIDIGSGAGLPGIPLKISRPSWDFTLLEATAKKVNFMHRATRELGLEKIEAVHGRAEEAGRHWPWRESFDLATARAVAPLPVLLEYCLPFVRPGGVMVAMKGPEPRAEINSAQKALEVLAGSILKVDEFVLPYSGSRRSLIVVEKTGVTPTAYPRRAGRPSKRPL